MAYYRRREVFLMSLEEERKILFPIYYLYNEIQRAHAEDRITQDNIEEIRAQKRREFISAVQSSKVNMEKAAELANRLTTTKWYSVYIPNTQAIQDLEEITEDTALYALTTSDNPTQASLLTIKDYPDFYEAINSDTSKTALHNYVRIRKALHLPKEYVHINAGALEVLLAVLEISEDTRSTDLVPQFPAIFSSKVSSVEFPLDKLNSLLWSKDNLEPRQIEGQMKMVLGVEMGKPGEDAVVYCFVDYDALQQDIEISKELTHYDKSVLMAVNAIYNSGKDNNGVMSITQIYKAMGGRKRPADTDIEKINNSITKLSKAHITINAEKEAEKFKSRSGRVKYVYDSPVLPCERGRAYINGQLTESAIHVFRESPAISFAKERGQITTVKLDVLQIPLSQTQSTLQLRDYLIGRIARMRSSHSPDKILLATVYAKAGITTEKQRQRAQDKIKKILDHFKDTEFIKSYKMDKISIVVKL